MHDSGQVPIAELEPQVPPHTLDDDLVGKPTLRKYRVSSPSRPTLPHLLIIGFNTQMQQSPYGALWQAVYVDGSTSPIKPSTPVPKQ
jgi:hypothetical protein